MNAHGPEPQRTPSLAGTLLRLACLLSLLGTLAHAQGERIATHLLPALRAEMAWLDDTYRIEALLIDNEGPDRVVRVVVSLAHCIVLEGAAHCAPPTALANASTLLGHMLTPAIVLLACVLAWPWSPAEPGHRLGWPAIAARLLLVPPALALLWALDVPFVLWACLWSLHVDAFAPDLWSPLLNWSQFLQSGGRTALAVAFAVGVLRCSAWLDRPRSR